MGSTDIQRVTSPPALPPRSAQGHKGTFGRLLIIGGSDEMIGAPVLAGTAALRTGAGLVQVAIPKSVLPAALSITPELIGLGLLGDNSDHGRLHEAAESSDAIVIGPGLGQQPAAKALLKEIVGLYKPMVVDADGLNLLAGLKHWPASSFHARAVLTPHPMEMRRLSMLLPAGEASAWAGSGKIPADDAARESIAILAARTFGQIVLLKGPRTIVTDGTRVYANQTGDSTLAKAGSGDILSGMISCLLAQGVDPFEAACLGAHLHGSAGESAGRKYGIRSALGRDVIDEIGAVLIAYEAAKAI